MPRITDEDGQEVEVFEGVPDFALPQSADGQQDDFEEADNA